MIVGMRPRMGGRGYGLCLLVSDQETISLTWLAYFVVGYCILVATTNYSAKLRGEAVTEKVPCCHRARYIFTYSVIQSFNMHLLIAYISSSAIIIHSFNNGS